MFGGNWLPHRRDRTRDYPGRVGDRRRFLEVNRPLRRRNRLPIYFRQQWAKIDLETGRDDAPFVFVSVGGEERRMRCSEWDALPIWTGERPSWVNKGGS